MRAHEFLSEVRSGKIGKRRQCPTRGLHTFQDIEGRDRFYELNRVMMAVARSDGDTTLNLPDSSWVGRQNTAHPYTELEDRMLKQAYKAIGSEYRDLNRGDLRSQELPSTNVASPIKPFRGYPR